MAEQRRTVREVLEALDDWVEQQARVTQLLLSEAEAVRKGQPSDGAHNEPPDSSG